MTEVFYNSPGYTGHAKQNLPYIPYRVYGEIYPSLGGNIEKVKCQYSMDCNMIECYLHYTSVHILAVMVPALLRCIALMKALSPGALHNFQKEDNHISTETALWARTKG